MKRLICCLMTALLAITLLGGCGGDTQSAGGEDSEKVYEWKFASIYPNPAVTKDFVDVYKRQG